MPEDILNQPDIDEISDRRLEYRVKLDVPVEVEYRTTGHELAQYRAQASQISRRGLTLVSKQPLPLNSEVLIRIPIPNSKSPILSTGKIAWSASRNGGTMHGVEFLHIPRIHLPYLTRFLSQSLVARDQLHERRVHSQIISELIEFDNRAGKRIVGFHDHLVSTKLDAPFLIIPAAYGETKINSLQIAYYLAVNGFNVVRFDPTDHIGESEGDHLDYTMPKLKDDILSALDYVSTKSPVANIGIVAASLAARSAFKAVSEDRRPVILISLVGVVNTQYTLHRVQNEDLVGTYLAGKVWDITNVLGHDVRLHEFLVACVDNGLHNLETTIEDLSQANCPILFFCGENDPWVQLDETQQAIQALPAGKREVQMISSMHKLKENPSEAKRAFRLIVVAAFKYLKGIQLPPDRVVDPRAREIGVQGRLEKERQKHLTDFNVAKEKGFWEGYLNRFHYIYAFPDYRNLLDTIVEELGSLNNGDYVLDAGCGNGNFGLWLLAKLSEGLERKSESAKIAFHYIAADIVQEALDRARDIHTSTMAAMKEKFALGRPLMAAPTYYIADLNSPLPFLDNTFDKICSNLVISYLANPVLSVREMIRVLKPGGKLVFTTLKKDADVSQIYRNFVEHATAAYEIEEAKNLLSNAGKILEKETEGYFHFFSERQLQMLVNQAQAGCSASYRRCFANQAIAVTITK